MDPTTFKARNAYRNKALLILSHALAVFAGFNMSFMASVRLVEQCPRCPKYCTQTVMPTSNRSDPMRQRSLKNSLLAPLEHINASTPQKTATKPLIPSTLKKVAAGMGRVNRDDFFRTFDLGVPFMPSSDGNEEVLLLFDEHSLPYPRGILSEEAIPLLPSADAATKRCMSMKMILTYTDDPYSCFAIMGQWESYLVHKWMRISKGKRASFDQPFRLVSRSQQRFDQGLPFEFGHVEDQGFDFLTHYLSRLKETLSKLRPVAQTTVEGKKEKTIILIMCNYGQSELFINFVCSARSRGLDVSQVLLFATDSEMEELGKKLGIVTFYDDKLFGVLPISKEYLDVSFKKFMAAKVCIIHLVHKLKYNLLFQDVDVMWHRHPLEYFSSPQVGDFDLIYQDDGNRVLGQEAHFANGGFFYIRQNKRTEYFFSVLIRHADFIFAFEEQTAMNLLINEHMSLTGLRVKTLNRDDALFLGGWHYHRRPELMKQLMNGTINPYTFHMSWTSHLTEKHQFLEQMGYFFVADMCVGKSVKEISLVGTNNDVATTCCLAESKPRCYYRDKPSRRPCDDSPPFEKGGASFWSSTTI